jgi:hypothetical protein
MSISDEAFREAFKPLYVPATYEENDSDENKVVYALAQLGEGTSDEVALELSRIDHTVDTERLKIIALSILNDLYSKGLISGSEVARVMQYNLNKITEANDGAVNPDLLAPGLD